MELKVSVLSVSRRYRGLYVRLAASCDAEPAPCYHFLDLEAIERTTVLRWTSLKPTAETRLIWEVCRIERTPPEEGGDPEPVIVGGAKTDANGRGRVVLRGFYADTNDVLAELEVRLSGLPLPNVAPSARGHQGEIVLERLQTRYEAYYETATPRGPRDRYMRVPVFRFYGSEVQASYLALMRGGMDEDFARSVLAIVLEDAGMSREEFVALGREQLSASAYLEQTAAIVARVGEFCTFTANIMRYRADLSVSGELVEMIVPHVRDVLGGDCEDLAIEIYFCFHALRAMKSSRDEALAVAGEFASLYVPFLATTVATSPAAGGSSKGELLHIFTLALTLAEVRARVPAGLATEIEKSERASRRHLRWASELPNLAPLEGTNWCDVLHLPQDLYYGRLEEDVAGLEDVQRRETLALRLSPELKRVPTRIRQELGADLSETGFSSFYRRVTELWTSDFAEGAFGGVCCFSVVRAGKYGVSLGQIASKGEYELAPVFEHSRAELVEVRRALRCTMPVPEWKGKIRRHRVQELEAVASARVSPKRISRLHADTIVYHFRSEALVASPKMLTALRKLEARFDVSYRAWRLPPQGDQKYVAVYAREK